MNSIEVSNLEKQYGSFKAVRGISFDVKEGEIFGFLGPNGAGKSTTINMLTGQLKPTSGEARVCDVNVIEKKRIREMIGIVPQELSLNDLLTAEQNLRLYGTLYNVQGKELNERSHHLLEAMGLAERKKTLVKDFSGGMKQRLNVILGLLHDPKVLFLDEPTTGMDTQARRMMWDFIKQVNKKGITVFLTTHYMEEADYLCDRVAIIDEGVIQAIDTPAKLKRQLKHENIITIQLEEDEQVINDVESIAGIKNAFFSRGELKLYIEDRDGLLLDIAKALEGRPIKSITSVEPTLDDVFISLTGKRLRD
ncbi:MAG TPA: ATP-binding cassette domain-containing protein [Methanomicrobia archaeon]|nr:ATP-binding cassette domain-containing protein [Methanomicrobia archaeon]